MIPVPKVELIIGKGGKTKQLQVKEWVYSHL